MTSYHHYLHQKALKIAETFRKTESELLEILQKIDQRRIFRELGYASLFEYATKALKLSEAVAYSFIQIARKAKEIPELKAAIDQGNLSISNARRLVPVITPQNQSELLTMAKSLPKRELEKEVARLNPQRVVVEKARYVTEQRLELKIGVSEELMKKLQRLQDLISSRERRAITLEETLEMHDPIEKAKRVQKRQRHRTHAVVAEKALQAASGGEAIGGVLVPGPKLDAVPEQSLPPLAGAGETAAAPLIPAQSKHAVVLRDQGRCTYVSPAGEPCQQQRWLQFHHLHPKSEGGNHAVENLQLLCAGHHRTVHHR